jgi:hypothetical protein
MKSKTQRHYDESPSSRAAKAKYQKAYNAKPENVKKRSTLNKINRDRGTYGNGDKKDASHTKNGVVMKPQSVNRGSTKDSPGDRRARGRAKR